MATSEVRKKTTNLGETIAMNLIRRRFLALAGSAAALSLAPRVASALDYPTRPVRILVGFGAGSGLDLYARIVARWLSDRFNQSFVIENRVGAGSNVAAEAAVNAIPDGYTLFMASAAQLTNATLYPHLNFNFIRDMAPVASVSRGPFAIVCDPSFAPKTMAELISYAKANPGKVTFGSTGTGTLSQVAGELLKMMAGIDMVHVPYHAEPQALVDIFGRRLDIEFSTLAGSSEFIRSGKLRALALTSANRSELFPAIPVVSETVPGYEATPWAGICAPKATPADIIEKLNQAVNAGLNNPKVKAQFAAIGTPTTALTPAEYGHAIVSQTEKWAKVIRAAYIKVE
jgi:tripartite-type tricarboxylate transporter receptor subunit TctC